jgi:hypothetical protein
MSRRRIALVSAVVSLSLFAVVPGAASGQASDLSITHAEMVLALSATDYITVGGNGNCASAGSVMLTAKPRIS